MTASLGVEVTAGPVPRPGAAARALVDRAGAELLETLADARRPARRRWWPTGSGRGCSTTARRRPSAEDRELAELLARADDVEPAASPTRCGAAEPGLARSTAAEGGLDPDRASRKTRAVQAARASGRGPAPAGGRAPTARWPGSTGRAATPGLRLSPIDVGPALAAVLWGEVTAVLTSATIPPRLVERVGLEGFATEQLDVGSPFDYRAHALLYVARHLPDRRAAGAEEALHEELALLIDAAGGRTLALFTSRRATEAAADGAGARAALHAAAPGRAPQGPPPRGVRRATRPPASSPPWASGRGWTSRSGTVAGDPRPAALPPARRPVAPGPARAGRRAAPSAGRPPPGRHAAGPGCGPPHPHGRRPWGGGVLDPRLATAGYRGVLLADAAAHAAHGRARRGRGIPAARPGRGERRSRLSSRARSSISERCCQCSPPSRGGRGRPLGQRLARTAMPTALRISPPLPMTMPFCESRSTMISTADVRPFPFGDPAEMECGSSSWVLASSCSRTSSATQSASGVSVTTSSGKKGGPSSSGLTRCAAGPRRPRRCGPTPGSTRRRGRRRWLDRGLDPARRSRIWSPVARSSLLTTTTRCGADRRRPLGTVPRDRDALEHGAVARADGGGGVDHGRITSTSVERRWSPSRSAASRARCGAGAARACRRRRPGASGRAGPRGCGAAWCWAATT